MTTLRRPILVAAATAPILALATATAPAVRSQAATVCGGAASDIVGRFAAHRTPAAGAPDAGDQEVATVTFSAPNTVTTDDEATTGGGHPVGSLKGSGSFTVGPPLGWTEQGTYHYDDGSSQGRTGPYRMSFTASRQTCTAGTQVSSFTGAFTGSGSPRTDTETFTRQP